ncbi:MAG TPA: PKD domain-containing protein [Vicinamibacterales bacterium]|nr:PKD domain-containing protein [Vicinamibacterales bacterium]
MSTFRLLSLASLVLFGSACTVEKVTAPPLSGPSGFALNLTVSAVPDSILQDGASQTVIQIQAIGPDGRPARGLPLRVEILFNGSIQDFGTLSAKTVVTGDDGRARVTYTSPPRPSDAVDRTTIVTIRVTPIGTNFGGETPRTVDLRLVPPGILLPPNDPPQAQFTVTPTAPQVLTNVIFDASGSTDGGVPCGAACTYNWDFGDGTSGTGVFVTHQYQRVGTFLARLTVTDGRGAASTTTRTLTVGQGAAPTAAFTFSPQTPAINQPVFFTAEASRAASGRRIVSYEWNFGTGSTASGMNVEKTFGTPGSFTVTLTVTDDAGQQATISQTIVVGGAGTGPQANLTVSPTTGSTATNFFFDASRTTGPSPIVEYRFTFGDATPDVVGTSPTTTHQYARAGNYLATVRVRDSAGRTATAQVTVTVQ